MDNQRVKPKGQPTQKKSIFTSPSYQSLEAFAVPLPVDLEDGDPLVLENMTGRKPNYEQKELKAQYSTRQDKAAEHSLAKQYEEKIRPCMDLIDNLRALGIEKDLSLPKIAVIGEQSSGKSSIIEALSGVALPRGNGVVTRCPLELKLKRAAATQAWKGKISYRNISTELQNASEVERAVREAQDAVAGTRGAISGELISLDIWSPDAPDLTLIDLPGTPRAAMGNQLKDIGEQIKMLLKKIIGSKDTLNLVVVPCNVDIATTEALKMAQEVDPSGERTLGVLTKPDLVDRGAEESVINIIQNRVIPLKKGYMIVKCRGQQDVFNKQALAIAIEQERIFFDTHKHFRIFMEERKATIPYLAEKLMNELLRCITKILPALESQLREALQKTLQDLQKYRRSTPRTESEQLIFLADMIKLFNQDITQTMRGEEQVVGNEIRLFAKIRREFRAWGDILRHCDAKVMKIVPSKLGKYEDQCRGREFPGFSNHRLFEDIVREQMTELEEPAIEIMNHVFGLVEEHLLALTKRHFANFQILYRAIKARIEAIKEKQEVEAERLIRTQFKIEKIVYCQDDLYISNLNSSKAENATKGATGKEVKLEPVLNQVPDFVQEMMSRTKAYFNGATKRLSNQIPLIILSSALHDFGDTLQSTMLHLLQEKDKLSLFLQEDSEAAKHRDYLSQRADRLTKACQYLKAFTSL